MPASPGGRSRAPLLITLAGFVALGAPDGILGVAWPSIRATFGLPLAGLGGLLVCLTAGYLVGSAASGFIADRLGPAAVLGAGFGASTLAALAYAVAPRWPVLLVAAAAFGLGSGTVDAGGNAHLALNHGVRAMNLLHACYGVGAAAGPAALTGLLARGLTWRLAYAGLLAVDLALVAAVAVTWRRWPGGRPRAVARPSSGGPLPVALVRLVVATLAMFFVYTAVEVATGQWSYTFPVTGRMAPAPLAGLAVSAFWASLTIGRVLGAVAGGRLGPLGLLHLSVAMTVTATVLYWLAPAAPLALAAVAAVGFALAPFFPALVTLTSRRVGERAAARVVGFQLAAAGAGGSLGAAAIGLALQQGGVGLLGPCLVAGAAVLAALHVATTYASRDRDRSWT